jgi:cytochrome c oxidase subunit 2
MKFRTFVAAVAVAFALSIAGALADTPSPTGITLVASNWQFTPGAIVAHPGETIVLHAKSTEGAHALISTDLAIKPVMLLPGAKPVDVTFVAPTKPGKYYIHCHLPCGPGHDKMTIVVEVVQS